MSIGEGCFITGQPFSLAEAQGLPDFSHQIGVTNLMTQFNFSNSMTTLPLMVSFRYMRSKLVVSVILATSNFPSSKSLGITRGSSPHTRGPQSRITPSYGSLLIIDLVQYEQGSGKQDFRCSSLLITGLVQ